MAKTGRPKGRLNRRTMEEQRELLAGQDRAARAGAAAAGIDIRNLSHKDRLAFASDVSWSWFTAEHNASGASERAEELLRLCVYIDDRAAPYWHPRLAVHKMIDVPQGDEPITVKLIADGVVKATYVNGEVVSGGDLSDDDRK